MTSYVNLVALATVQQQVYTVQWDNFGGDKNSVISVISLSIENFSIEFFFQIKPPFRHSYIL